MNAADLDACADLELRLCLREVPDEPPPLAAFMRPLPRVAVDAGDDDDEDLLGEDALVLLQSVALAEGALAIGDDPHARLLPLAGVDVGAPIPLPVPEVAAPLPLADWQIAAEARGHLAILRGRGVLRTLSIAAVTLPLLIPAPPAAAADRREAPEVQRPTTSTPAPARAEPEDMPIEPAAPPEPEDPPAPDEAAPAAAPAREGGVPDAFWQAMKGQEVVLVLDSGRRPGRLVASDADSILFVDYNEDGRLRVLPKERVLEIRGAVGGLGRPGVPMGPPPGGGRIGGGIAMAVAGTPLLLTGLVFFGVCPSCLYISLPTFVPGAILLGVGIPLIVKWTRMRREWYAKQGVLSRVTPGVSVTPRGWSGGLTLRF